MPSAKADPRTQESYQGLIEALIALPPSEDADVYKLFESQRDDCQITCGVPLTLEDLERVSEVLSRSSKVQRLVKDLRELPASIPERGNVPYF